MDFMYDIVLPNLREIPGGVCACKKQNKVFFLLQELGLIMKWAAVAEIYFRSNTGELLVTSQAQYSNGLQELKMLRWWRR